MCLDLTFANTDGLSQMFQILLQFWCPSPKLGRIYLFILYLFKKEKKFPVLSVIDSSTKSFALLFC